MASAQNSSCQHVPNVQIDPQINGDINDKANRAMRVSLCHLSNYREVSWASNRFSIGYSPILLINPMNHIFMPFTEFCLIKKNYLQKNDTLLSHTNNTEIFATTYLKLYLKRTRNILITRLGNIRNNNGSELHKKLLLLLRFVRP